MNIKTEKTLESAIIASLTEHGGYTFIPTPQYSKELALDKTTVLTFLQTTQAKQWERLTAIHGNLTEIKVLQRLFKELDLRGTLDVLRKGFIDYGVRFSMAYFKPDSNDNPDTLALYAQNRLTVMRQVYYSDRNKNSLDLVLFLNGLPVATAELKNQFTGQNVHNAIEQYKNDRDPRELLFQFKKRALVHFAVDPDEIYMTTKLDETATRFLPFNKGHNHGKGNPPSDGYRTAYLWENMWQKDSWLEILGRFIHLQKEEKTEKSTGKTYVRETMIFPRYHQLDAVRQLINAAYRGGVGKNYLIQHSAGSGKSNSIAWLAHRLSVLHKADDTKVFDGVIVITDRRVLDKQLQDTIYQFDHKTGVVQKIDNNSDQLAKALTEGTLIIITTLQKFSFVLDKVSTLPARAYAVVIDEAHSSQGGDAAKNMKRVLGIAVDEDTTETDANDDNDVEDDIRKEVEARSGQQSNVSFFAFTATPKPKTLEVFGVRSEDGKPRPAHLYSMRQAIEEGFILDVLKTYTTYNRYFRLSKAIEDDPNLNKKKAAQAIARFINFHPHNLAQKTEVIIEHFRQIVSKKIGGKAKAMVVTASRLHAVRYFEEFKRYISEKGYTEIGILVAFSGKVFTDAADTEGVTEPQLNGLQSERELPTAFDTDDYRILLVADKYQTGFDQPLLHTMYVDKRLSGVKAVQTLSRLNRTCAGKEDTFVLDFVNDREEILASFQPFYELTTVEESPDPNHLYDLKTILDDYRVYADADVQTFTVLFFKKKDSLTYRDQNALHKCLDPLVETYKNLEIEKAEEFKKGLRTWTNLYAFMAQIMPFKDIELEKFYAFAKLLQSKLPRRTLNEQVQLNDELALEYYRLEKVAEGSIAMEPQVEYGLKHFSEAGMKRDKDERALLSEIINVLNDKFGTDFTTADKLFFDQIEQVLVDDITLQQQAKSNSMENFKYGFDDKFGTTLIERMDNNQDIFNRIFEDKDFGELVKTWMLKKVYDRIRTEA
jgi:type I restriction enzyme, R subunit